VMEKISAVIIDDLQESRQLLSQDLADYCDQIEVIGEADGVVSGLKLIKSKSPDLVFLDINMNDGSGFDLLEIVDKHDFRIIFTTASDLYAIKAFKFSAVDYLLKPIDIDELVAAVNKLTSNAAATVDNYKLLKSNLANKEIERIALHTQDKIHICSIDEIVRCESSVNYTTFYFSDGSKKMITKTLKYFDQILGGSGFLRVHQSHLINTDFIREYVRSDGGYITMKDEALIPISNRKKAEIVKLISAL
jgi:two-component system LytT family response regulator